MDTDKRVLIILDDLWQELDLHEIGIPERKGLKVLFTSRLTEVCNTMGAELFEVELLSREEAWHLFKKTAEISEKAIEGVAKEVAAECGGLPIAIVTVGKALKNKKEHAWRVACEELKKASVTSIHGMQDKVYSRIKWSYDYLENVDSKKLLLLCSLFPEYYDIPLEDLIKYATGLQLFQDVETIAGARDRVCTIIDELKSCYLLLEGCDKDEKCVKIHDVVRDVCLSIASEGEQVYMVMHARLKEWPQKESYAFYTCISLSFAHEMHQLPSGLECPNLKLLRLIFQQEQRVDMPKDFFKEMKQLKVLQVENLESEVPSSLQLLVNLRTLWLVNCILHGDVSIIQSLNKLEILSFCDSYRESSLDNIMKILKNLKFLDLGFWEGPSIPLDSLVSLEKLEQVYLGDSDSEHLVDANKIMSSGGGAGGVFLNLEKLDIRNAYELEELFHGNLPRGSFAKLREVRLEYLPALRHLWAEVMLPIKFLQSLERVDISDCSSLEVVFDFKGLNVEGAHVQTPLGCLQILRLSYLPQVKHIWRMLPKGIHAFENLRQLKVDKCPNLRYLLSPSMAKVLGGLETLVIYKCFRVEAIIGMGKRAISKNIVKKNEDGEETANKIEFPKLRRLKVLLLDNLRMLCSGNIDLELPSLTELVITRCPRMTKFCAGHLSATRLNNVKVYKKDVVSLDEFKSWMKDCELKIRCLECSLWKVEECDHLH